MRSALFVPAQRSEFLAKVDTTGADAVILDLEDAVAESGKALARNNARSWLADRPQGRTPLVMARINTSDQAAMEADLDALVDPSLVAVLVPKIESPDDVTVVSDLLSWHEGRIGLPRGQILIWPIIESAGAVRLVDEIARSSERVEFLGGGTSTEGDLARSLSFECTAEGLETLYLRSRVLVAARAAGVENPMTGLVSELADLEEVHRFAVSSRQLGYDGMMVIHPSHIATVNEVFTPTAESVEDARRIISSLEQAGESGIGAIQHDGRMVDVAMAQTAQKLLVDAERTALIASDESDDS